MGREDAGGKVICPYGEESQRRSCSKEFDKGTAIQKCAVIVYRYRK